MVCLEGDPLCGLRSRCEWNLFSSNRTGGRISELEVVGSESLRGLAERKTKVCGVAARFCATGAAAIAARPQADERKESTSSSLPYPEYSAPGDLRQDPPGAVESLASAGLSDRGQNFLE
jgi:hypothetical protein